MPGEFEFIDNLKSKYSLDKVGDDCAVLPKDTQTDLLLTADMLVEDIDFRLDWTTPEMLGHKALAISLSDIAAMGGKPVWSLLSLGVPESLWSSGFMDRFYTGWFALAGKYGVELAGGDISRTPDKLVIDCIVGGEVEKGNAVMRSGAGVGDSVYITGPLGGASGGLLLLEIGERLDTVKQDSAERMLVKQLQPQPELEVGILLQLHKIPSSMIDVSDGLSSDLAHLCRASGVGCRLFADKVPMDPDLAQFSAESALKSAWHGGEDFRLLFTSPHKNISAIENHQISGIGEITANVGVIEVIGDGKSQILEAKGYRHF